MPAYTDPYPASFHATVVLRPGEFADPRCDIGFNAKRPLYGKVVHYEAAKDRLLVPTNLVNGQAVSNGPFPIAALDPWSDGHRCFDTTAGAGWPAKRSIT